MAAAPAPAPAPRKQVNMADIMQPGVLLVVAALITLMAGAVARNVTTIIIALIMIYSAIVSFDYIAILKELFPVLSVSAVCGAILFFWNIETLIRGVVDKVPPVLGFIAGIVALFAAFVGYFKPSFARK